MRWLAPLARCDRDRARPLHRRLGAPRAAVLLARPGPGHLRAAAGGGRGPRGSRSLHGAAGVAAGHDARRLPGRRSRARRACAGHAAGCARHGAGAPPRRRSAGRSAGCAGPGAPIGTRSAPTRRCAGLRRSLAAAAGRLQAPPEPARARAEQAGGAAAVPLQRASARPVPVRLDPGGGQRLAQQRPRRDHARPLHRAGLAAGARERPEVQPEPPAERPDGHADAELRVPGDLPERPEPDLRPGPGGQGRAARRRRGRTATASPRRSSATASAATSRSRARASSPRT